MENSRSDKSRLTPGELCQTPGLCRIGPSDNKKRAIHAGLKKWYIAVIVHRLIPVSGVFPQVGIEVLRFADVFTSSTLWKNEHASFSGI